MQLVSYNNLNIEERRLFYTFLKQASKDTTQPAHVNMWHDDWISHPNTLPYLLDREKRFNNPFGEFFILKKENTIVGCSGVYVSNFSKDICIGGCRTWIAKEQRNNSLVRDYLLPAQKTWAKENNIKVIALSFNQYNKNIITIWKRVRLGESRSPREFYHIFYDNFNEVSFLVNVQNTPQWIIYEKLDNNFNFDWQKIKHQ